MLGAALVVGLAGIAWQVNDRSARPTESSRSPSRVAAPAAREPTQSKRQVLAAAAQAVVEPFVAPDDGMFYVEREPRFTFEATLAEDWVAPHSGDGVLNVFAPVAPALPGQANVTTRLFVAGRPELRAEPVAEAVRARAMLRLRVASDVVSPQSGIPLRVEYAGTLFARTLKRGAPREPVLALTLQERQQYLAASSTMDHRDSGFPGWLDEQRLRRRGDEQVAQFAHRVFTHFVAGATYGGDTSSYEARRPSRVIKSFASDCGGLSLLFVAVMRANEIPARTLFGRWAIPQTDEYGQYHVVAEFFVDESGWVPVDISGTIVHRPQDQNALFGNSDGQLMIFHIDPDLEPAPRLHHAWAQYLLLQWSGDGDFWNAHQMHSTWSVRRRPIEH